MINQTIHGDAVKLLKEGEFDILIHGCNCLGIMGTGIAGQLKRNFPSILKADLQFKPETIGKKERLGLYSFRRLTRSNGTHFHVINAYTQLGVARGSGLRVADYKAIAKVFAAINEQYKEQKFKIAIPAIGAGLANGNWEEIASIINENTKDIDITLVLFSGTQGTAHA